MDNLLIEKFDRMATWAQKQGLLLTSLIVYACATVLITNVAYLLLREHRIGAAIVGIIWSICLWASIRFALSAQDYPENVRKMQALNAWSLEKREDKIWRFGRLWVFFTTFWSIVFNLWLWREKGVLVCVLDTLSSMSMMVLFYLECCTFLGPGEFNKSKQEKYSGQESFDRT